MNGEKEEMIDTGTEKDGALCEGEQCHRIVVSSGNKPQESS
jgi:hypothetical protein